MTTKLRLFGTCKIRCANSALVKQNGNYTMANGSLPINRRLRAVTSDYLWTKNRVHNKSLRLTVYPKFYFLNIAFTKAINVRHIFCNNVSLSSSNINGIALVSFFRQYFFFFSVYFCPIRYNLRSIF